MSKKFAFIAILATALALPATGALARGGGGGGGGHMGGGFGGGHMGGGFGGGHVGGGFGGPTWAALAGRGAFASAGEIHGHGIHMRSHGRRFIGRGFGGYGYYDPCWQHPYTYGLVCDYPY